MPSESILSPPPCTPENLQQWYVSLTEFTERFMSECSLATDYPPELRFFHSLSRPPHHLPEEWVDPASLMPEQKDFVAYFILALIKKHAINEETLLSHLTSYASPYSETLQNLTQLVIYHFDLVKRYIEKCTKHSLWENTKENVFVERILLMMCYFSNHSPDPKKMAPLHYKQYIAAYIGDTTHNPLFEEEADQWQHASAIPQDSAPGTSLLKFIFSYCFAASITERFNSPRSPSDPILGRQQENVESRLRWRINSHKQVRAYYIMFTGVPNVATLIGVPEFQTPSGNLGDLEKFGYMEDTIEDPPIQHHLLFLLWQISIRLTLGNFFVEQLQAKSRIEREKMLPAFHHLLQPIFTKYIPELQNFLEEHPELRKEYKKYLADTDLVDRELGDLDPLVKDDFLMKLPLVCSPAFLVYIVMENARLHKETAAALDARPPHYRY